LLLPRPQRTHGEAADAHDPVLRAERIQHLGRFFGQADDAVRTDGPPGFGIRDSGFGKTALLFRIPNPESRIPAVHGYNIRFVQVPATSSPSYSQRSCRRESPAYQNSIARGRTRRPVQRGGRGTSRPSNSASAAASACSKASRDSSVSDCFDTHAPIWLPRGRVAK